VADGGRRGVEDLVPGSQLLVDYDWRLSATTSLQRAFPHGSTSLTETGRRISWWGGDGVLHRFWEKELEMGDESRLAICGGLRNGGRRSQRG
jgi:hypothetical protein